MKQILKLFILLLFPVSISGQITPVTNQYILNPLTINPGYAGNRGALNLAAFYRNQWVGIPGSPETMSLAVDAPLFNERIGLGLLITNYKLGVTKENRLNTNYSFKIRMKEGILSLGMGAGLVTTNTAWSDLIIVDQEDSHLLVDSPVFVVPDFTFGVYYSYHNYFAGISIPNLIDSKFNFNKNKYTQEVNPEKYYYLFNTGYVFELASRTKFFPSTLVTFTPGKKVQYDINAHFSFFNILWVGGTYRSTRSIAGLLQLAVNNQLRVAYTYDFDLGMLGKYNTGSHEIMLRFEFSYKVDAVSPLNIL